MAELHTEQYVMLRNALLEMRDDTSAVMSLLSFQPDNGVWWVESANQELRSILIQGRLDDADRLGGLISSVLQIQEGGVDDELAENQIFSEGMRWLVEGIGAILEREPRLGITQLENLTSAVYSQESLQWVAWFWISKAAGEVGEVETALAAARDALALSARLDDQARSTSLRNLGELAFLAGNHEEAVSYLTKATDLFAQIGDDHGRATTHLARARMEHLADRPKEAMDAALWAREADPEWDEPVLFLARQALMNGNPARAAAVLYPFMQRENPSAEVLKEMRLVGLLQRGEVTAEVMSEYCRLRELAPTDKTVGELGRLVDVAPHFMQLREHLGWQLIKLGFDEQATPHFEYLGAQTLDADLQSSVLLGLGCLANRRHRHRQTGARLRKASEAARGGSAEHPAVGGTPESPPRSETSEGLRKVSPATTPQDDDDIVVDEPDLDPAALAAALNQSTVLQPAAQRDAMLEEVVQLEAAPPGPSEGSFDFTVWAGPEDDENEAVPAGMGSQTMRLSGDMLDSLAGESSKGGIPRTDTGAIKFDVGDPMPKLSSENRPARITAKGNSQPAAAATGGQAAAKAAFTGDLQLLAVPDLLEFLKSSRRTGTLVVTSENGIGAVYLKGGNITGAASPNCVNLGEILKQDGAITEDALKEAASRQKSERSEQLLGEILVSKGLVPEAAIRKALARQVQSAILEMLDWTSGRFAFEPEHTSAAGDNEIEIVLDTQGVLLDALREYDEQNR